MLIPRFSIRGLFGLITVCSLLFLVLSFAVRGDPWAIASIAGVASLLLTAVVHASFFAVTWVLSLFGAGQAPARPTVEQLDGVPLPPQIVRPVNPE